ncbi:MAG: thioester domain-containing protein, partial [Oscillospiraceae bacterium]|nr:thioester domain-containing protein [Oscillospiraceae bacterium]
MTHTKTRWMAFVLAALMLFGLLPMSAFASSIGDGSATAALSLGNRNYFLKTTAGTSLGVSTYQYTTNDGLTGPGFCLNHGLDYTARRLPISGKYTASPQAAGAVANGYPQHSLDTFLGLYLNTNSILNGLTEDEYAYATQVAVWAALGQLAIDGTAFTSGRERIAQPTGDTQKMRVFRAAQLILDVAKSWTFIPKTGMYICAEDGKLGANVSVPGDMTLDYAADNEQYGFKREVIGGVSYYTREYTIASATST